MWRAYLSEHMVPGLGRFSLGSRKPIPRKSPRRKTRHFCKNTLFLICRETNPKISQAKFDNKKHSSWHLHSSIHRRVGLKEQNFTKMLTVMKINGRHKRQIRNIPGTMPQAQCQSKRSELELGVSVRHLFVHYQIKLQMILRQISWESCELKVCDCNVRNWFEAIIKVGMSGYENTKGPTSCPSQAKKMRPLTHRCSKPNFRARHV